MASCTNPSRARNQAASCVSDHQVGKGALNVPAARSAAGSTRPSSMKRRTASRYCSSASRFPSPWFVSGFLAGRRGGFAASKVSVSREGVGAS